jgi:hypothetical protein
MSIDQNIPFETQQANAGNRTKFRKPYRKPHLEDLGDLRTLTLGASPAGFKDSGGGLFSETFPTLAPPTPPG